MSEYEKEIDELINDYDMLRVLKHFTIAHVDYAKNITRYTEIPQMRVREYLKRLKDLGLLDYYTNTSIKRTEAKLKKSAEVHKHHTYYQINKKAEAVLKEITPKLYVHHLKSADLQMLCSRKERKENPEACSSLLRMGLIDKCYDLTDLGREVFDTARRMQILHCEDRN
ncbi:conserved hypothetical protein [Thermoplasma acidophilum]|uniref:DUF2250 domain-containing protein n=1 Tax=Thermoplasma acidophilum (strain ATCC 25905 / DSM 1728 / JCM 9062 / NBRC 15155 / AMRC-C165) TaxID=273075 RepID=Q9HLB2_THEAC|nr:DUF2250 domain-containing protein [Thermoplasma acidophilum]MCY0851394.1 DUF2250 domain-containing protein [Thermoplasma acidophilum]CAC11462.1 conserved hypothetical protein [Thermoplasma acidophilum]